MKAHKISASILVSIVGLFLFALFFNACEDREYNNPYDENVKIDSLTPYDLQVNHIGILEKQLTWNCDADNAESFIIDKKTGEENWQEVFAEVNGETHQWTDTAIKLNKSHQYRVKAKFDEKKTSGASIDFEANMPAPENFEIMKNSNSSVTLNWDYSYSGHDGFQIDRKRDNESWETKYHVVDASTTSYTDEVDLLSHDYSYRIVTILDEHQSVTNEKSISLVEMVNVTGGTFEMGCTGEQSNCDSDETPVHTVTLSDFSISKYEITNAQYTVFLNAINCNSDGSYNDDEYGNVVYIDINHPNCQIDHSDGRFVVESGQANHPVIKVSWYGANAFAQMAAGRLPTEAEWEFAARGGNQSQGYENSGSNNLDEVGWYDDNSDGNTHEVGQKQPNELEIYDMSGNVWEWCHDWYDMDYYSNSPENNPEGPASGDRRVLRGGSYYRLDYLCRVANRNMIYPDDTYDGWGFRIAR